MSTQTPEPDTRPADAAPELAPQKTQCQGISRKTGERCTAWAVRGDTVCAGHGGRGKLDPAEGGRAKARVLRKRAEDARRTPVEAYRAALYENAERMAQRLVEIALAGDPSEALRAIETLSARVLGKPKETVEVQAEIPEDLAAVRNMSPEEREALWRRIQDRKLRAVS